MASGSIYRQEENVVRILLGVFGYLQPRDLGNCLLVSKGWNKIIRDNILSDPEKVANIWDDFLKQAWLHGKPQVNSDLIYF